VSGDLQYLTDSRTEPVLVQLSIAIYPGLVCWGTNSNRRRSQKQK